MRYRIAPIACACAATDGRQLQSVDDPGSEAFEQAFLFLVVVALGCNDPCRQNFTIAGLEFQFDGEFACFPV